MVLKHQLRIQNIKLYSSHNRYCYEVRMNKPFITYTAQVDKLQNEKNLIITDTNFAITTQKISVTTD